MIKLVPAPSNLPVKQLEAVLEYLWHSELDHYLECPPDEKHQSVFYHALIVAAWLSASGRLGECDGRSDLYGRMVASLRRRVA
jgi:hypothetical protein